MSTQTNMNEERLAVIQLINDVINDGAALPNMPLVLSGQPGVGKTAIMKCDELSDSSALMQLS